MKGGRRKGRRNSGGREKKRRKREVYRNSRGWGGEGRVSERGRGRERKGKE